MSELLQISEEARARIEAAIAQYPRREAALLPVLHLLQEELGYLSDEVMRQAAELVGVAPVRVYDAATFYTLFKKRPTGRYLIQLCRNLSCALLGAESLLEHLQRKLGIEVGQTTPDVRFTLETVECLAACDQAPMIQINEDYYGNLTPEKIDQILQGLS